MDKAQRFQCAVVQVQQYLSDVSANRGLDGLDDGWGLADRFAARVRELGREMEALEPADSHLYRELLATFEGYYEMGQRMAQPWLDQAPKVAIR